MALAPAAQGAPRATASKSLPGAGSRVAVSPQPGTPDASGRTQISFLGVPLRKLGRISVVGSGSGPHPGRLLPYSTHKGASFVPDRPFLPAEHVHVRMRAKKGGARALDFRFTIARPGPIVPGPLLAGALPPPPKTPPTPQTFISRPDLKLPPLTVATSQPGGTGGDIMVAPFAFPRPGAPPPAIQHGPAIYDPQGNLVWFNPIVGKAVFNFHSQTLNGAPVLVWWQGATPLPGVGFGENVLVDSSYRELGRVRAGNGYQADLHDFSISGGSAWMPIYTPVLADLSSVGGAKQGSLLDSIVQQVDIKTGLVMFEWHALGHIRVSETYTAPEKNATYDFTHINSIQALGGHTVLVSMRDTRAVYLVSTRTGKVLWRLGGQRSSFRMGPGARFAWQHDAQYHRGGILSLFDDEAFPPVRPPSRGLVLKLDVRRRRATVLRQYRHQPPVVAGSQGNMQQLPDGGELVGWGAEPFLTQYSRSGKLILDARFQPGVESYRAFREPWTGRPTDAPTLGAQAASPTQETVYASWNGATGVVSWQVLAGSNAGDLSIVGSAPRKGFETAITVPTRGPYFAVRAIGAGGLVLGTSKTKNASP